MPELSHRAIGFRGPSGSVRSTRRARVSSVKVTQRFGRVALGLAVLAGTALATPGTSSASGPAVARASTAAWVAAAPAAAAPSTPDQAQQAWLDAAREYSSFGERVLATESAAHRATAASVAARQRQQQAQQQLASENARVAAAQRRVDAADADLARTSGVTAGYQQQIDAFADASFRGARTGSMSAFLTATSPDDFLERASSLDIVADDNAQLLSAAEAAQHELTAAQQKATAERDGIAAVRDAARAREREAAAAASAATAAERRAVAATRALAADKQRLAGKVAVYQRTYARLSAADRDAAVQMTDGGVTVRNGESGSRSISVEDLSVRAAQQAPNQGAAIAVQAALSRVGLPYVWGATGPDSFDCSGLMLWAWAKAGVSIPRSSSEQAAGLREIPMSELQVGDLITFYRPTSHVGMYIGDGLFVHASHTGAPLMVTSLSKRMDDYPVAHAVGR